MNWRMFWEHLHIVLAGVTFAIASGVPLGVLAYMSPPLRKIILTTVEILRTVPTLALLGILMVIFGAGKATVIVGIVLFSLLPVVQNTYVGLREVDPAIKDVAAGMGMTFLYRLIHVELPLAFPLILTGIRIAATNSVGIAVFASFVGGGGLGGMIYNAIRVGNMARILSGTVALMAMSITFELALGFAEKKICARRPR